MANTCTENGGIKITGARQASPIEWVVVESTSDDNFGSEEILAEFKGYLSEDRAKAWLHQKEQKRSDEKWKKENPDSSQPPPSIPDD